MTATARALHGTEANALGQAAFLAFLAALLGYGGFLAYYTLASFDVVNLHRDALIDDAFYYFEIAKNLAAGEFSTFDGGITRTNGYHPVWLLLITPFYWIFDMESALFGIKALEIMLIAGGVCLLAVGVRLAKLPWILLFAVLPGLYCQEGMLMGMEAAAGAFFLGATLLAAVLFARDADRWRGLLAGIAFALPWVRLEYVAIALFVTAGLALMPGHGAAGQQVAGHFCATRLRAAGLPLVAAIAGIFAYFLYNGVVFGGIVPVSAASKLIWSSQGAGRGADWPKEVTAGFADAAGEDAAAVAELCGYLLGIWAIVRFSGPSNQAVGVLAVLATTLALGVENLTVKGLIALLYDSRLALYSYWYYVPGYLVAALLVPVRCYVAIFLLRRFVPDRWASWRRLAILAVCAVSLAQALDPYKFTDPFRFVAESGQSTALAQSSTLAGHNAVFDRMLPRDAVLGSWDAGAIGYFSDRPVVNLDGLASSYDYLKATPNKWALWVGGTGVPEFGVTHLVNSTGPWNDVLHAFGQGPRDRLEYVGHRTFETGEPYSMKLWRRDEGRLRARSWRSLSSPSVGVDGKGNGYRVLRHGRLVQLFVPDCAAGEHGGVNDVPEMVVFTWREGAESRRVQRLWVRPHRTQLGYCTMEFLLPHGAEKAARIHVDPTTLDQVVAGVSPVLRSRSGASVYSVQNRLVYVGEAKEDVLPGDRDLEKRYSSYFLNVRPAARHDLPHSRLDSGFVNYDHVLTVQQRRSGGRRLAEVELPAIEIQEIWTGEARAAELIWGGRVDSLALQPAAIDDFLAAAARIVRTTEWDVYRHEGERKLLYLRAGDVGGSGAAKGCAPGPVFLHVFPQRAEDLPEWRRQYGFANHDFDFGETGFVAGGRCYAAVRLPAYEVSHLVMGAHGRDPHTWHAERR